MAPKKSKPLTFLKKCHISVVGSLGKLAKTPEIEKWTINNGGGFTNKPDERTTHIICSWDTYRKDDFALPKKYLDNKKISIVEYEWMAKSLENRRAFATTKFLHSRKWDLKSRKKTIRRQALLRGKTRKDVERQEAVKEFGPAKSDTENESEDEEDDQAEQGESGSVMGLSPKSSTNDQDDTATDDSSTNYEVYQNEAGVVFDVALKGEELEEEEDGNYVLTILVDKDRSLYKTCYTYVDEEVDAPTEITIATTPDLNLAISSFEAFYENKMGLTWPEYCETVENQQGFDDE